MTTPERIPRVSIGMPIYNAGAFLKTTFESLLKQTYDHFELIVSDNASTDETESICRDLAARDSRIRYLRQERNRGSIWNFNETLRLARGEYFKWAAYDDLCAPTFLEKAVAVLDARPDVAWVHCQSRHIDEQGALLRSEDTPPISYVDSSEDDGRQATRSSTRPSDRFRAVLLGHGGCLDSYGLIRTEALRKTQTLLPYFGSEKVLMAELGLYGRYYEIPEVLFFARIHSAAMGSQKSSLRQRLAINPLARGFQFPRLRLLAGYCRAVRTSPIDFSDRLHCYAAIGRYLFQVQKWSQIVRNAIAGVGLSGEYPAVPTRSAHPEMPPTQTPSAA